MAETQHWYGIRGTHGLYRLTVPVSGFGFARPSRWTGEEWVSDLVWLEDYLEGRFDPDSVPVDEVERRFPGSTRQP